jgi:NAD(P)-dependent dehydrogenase (short-subunit alcohol dehydrogenase family)
LKTLAAYGAVHLLFNNAGVGAGSTVWESTLADWEWTLGVNLWGVIYGIHFFVPLMLEQNTECHIVNTASIAGLISGPGLGIYKVTKHGVVTLSETLYDELALRRAKIKVSVLCPGFINTRVMESARNRPAELQNDPSEEKLDAADKDFQAIRDEQFYILTHPELKGAIQTRMEDILLERNPTFSLRPE